MYNRPGYSSRQHCIVRAIKHHPALGRDSATGSHCARRQDDRVTSDIRMTGRLSVFYTHGSVTRARQGTLSTSTDENTGFTSSAKVIRAVGTEPRPVRSVTCW